MKVKYFDIDDQKTELFEIEATEEPQPYRSFLTKNNQKYQIVLCVWEGSDCKAIIQKVEELGFGVNEQKRHEAGMDLIQKINKLVPNTDPDESGSGKKASSAPK